MQGHLILDQKFKLTKTLGIGQYAKVKLGTDLRSGQKLAIKIHKQPTTTEELDSILREARLLFRLRGHPRIIQLESINNEGSFTGSRCESAKVIYFAMNNASKGELFKYICHTDRFSESLARTLFRKILEAVECCHSHGIAHRDLKAENILLTHDFQVKLADLGSAIEQGEDCNQMLFGSDEYNPPEVLAHFDEFANGCVDYDRFKGDVFSLGVLLFVMVLGLAPFRSARPSDPYYKRLNQAPQNFWKIFREYRLTDEFRILIEAMTAWNPEDRYTLADVKSSPWVQEEILGDDEVLNEMKTRDSMLQECALSRESPREVCIPLKQPDFDANKSDFDGKFEELRQLLCSNSDD